MKEPEKGSAEWRKQRPLWRGVMRYFPKALLEVAHVSWVGNEQHNPGQEVHWDRSKSTDEADACARHLLEAGTRDSDRVRHSAKAAWRALANLEKEIEAEEKPAYIPYDPQTTGVVTTAFPIYDKDRDNPIQKTLPRRQSICTCGWCKSCIDRQNRDRA